MLIAPSILPEYMGNRTGRTLPDALCLCLAGKLSARSTQALLAAYA